ncbi:MAG: M24 family metallopeptidase [Pseudomonadota bacterium]
MNAAVDTALAAAKPGVEARAVDLAARGVSNEADYCAQFIHRTGHGIGTGIGIDVHEPPWITAT